MAIPAAVVGTTAVCALILRIDLEQMKKLPVPWKRWTTAQTAVAPPTSAATTTEPSAGVVGATSCRRFSIQLGHRRDRC